MQSEKVVFSTDAMPSLDGVASLHLYRPGQVLFYAEHFPYGLFLLIDGTVEIEYLVRTIEEAQGGTILGAAAFLENTVYHGTARATTPCKIYFLSKTAFGELPNAHPELHQWLEAQLKNGKTGWAQNFGS